MAFPSVRSVSSVNLVDSASSGGPRRLASFAAAMLAVALAVALAVCYAVPATAQKIAVPYYGPEAFVAALQARDQSVQAARFEAGARLLVEAMAALCSAGEDGKAAPAGPDAAAAGLPDGPRVRAREAWLAAAEAWERLHAVSAGPTLARRSARNLDFRPSRPALIRRAIGTHGKRKEPPDAKALERVGTPAKGLPALEWLLWDPEAPQTPAACRYASGVALDVQREAEALAAAHAADAARDWREEAEAAEARAAEAVNQWLAGLEGLRWRQLGKPLSILSTTDARQSAARPEIWPRPSSGSHRDAWRARWEGLRNLAIGPAPTDGFSAQPAVAPAVISLEALLRGRGLNREADEWAKVVMTADEAMQALTQEEDRPPTVPLDPALAPQSSRASLPSTAVMQAAVAALDAVKQFMQDTVAPALKVTLGFSDADGD